MIDEPIARHNDDNQLLEGSVNATPNAVQSREEIEKKLARFGKPDKDTFNAYKYVIYKRSRKTVEYMRNLYQKRKEAQDNRSCLGKCGSMIKSLIVYAIVAVILIPALYELYNKAMDNGKSISSQ